MRINIVGVESTIRELSQVERAQILRKPMRRALAILENQVKRYPPTRPGQRYIRGRGPTNSRGRLRRETSERLGQSWTTKIEGTRNGLRGEVGTNVSYAPWVVADRFQAWMHRGRWFTDKSILDDNERDINRVFERDLGQDRTI